MQIKKYIAPTLKEATEQMKTELGGDAMILGTRVIEGDRKFNMKKMFEITAGIDKPLAKTSGANVKENTIHGRTNLEKEIERLTKKIYAGTEEPVHQNRRAAHQAAETPAHNKHEKELKEFSEILINAEVQKSIVNNLINQLENYDGLVDGTNLESYLLSGIASLVPTKEFKVKKNKTTTIALVGPTGVGKTTCIAKLAVISKIIHKLNVGLISIDTYRLGAIDQLKIFSEISDIDMAVAYDADEVPKLLKKFKNKDLVFIDTVGRSQRNTDNLAKIKEYLDSTTIDETVLVVSATTSVRTLNDITQKFKQLNYTSVIFTKADEAAAYGNILNTAYNHNVPVMFLTNGQVIPDDIISVNPDYLANLIYSGKLY